MLRFKPFDEADEFKAVHPADDIHARMKFLVTDPAGLAIFDTVLGIVHNSCQSVGDEAPAIFLRYMWGMRAPPQFQSIKIDDKKCVRIFTGYDAFNQPCYLKRTTFSNCAGQLVDTMRESIIVLVRDYIPQHMCERAFKLREACNPNASIPHASPNLYKNQQRNVANELYRYVQRDHHARTMQFQLERQMQFARHNRAQPNIPSKTIEQLKDRVPTDDFATRIAYILEHTRSSDDDDPSAEKTHMQFLVSQLRNALFMRHAPMIAFVNLWGVEAPERFQSFAPSSQNTHELVSIVDGTPIIQFHQTFPMLGKRMVHTMYAFLDEFAIASGLPGLAHFRTVTEADEVPAYALFNDTDFRKYIGILPKKSIFDNLIKRTLINQ